MTYFPNLTTRLDQEIIESIISFFIFFLQKKDYR